MANSEAKSIIGMVMEGVTGTTPVQAAQDSREILRDLGIGVSMRVVNAAIPRVGGVVADAASRVAEIAQTVQSLRRRPPNL